MDCSAESANGSYEDRSGHLKKSRAAGVRETFNTSEDIPKAKLVADEVVAALRKVINPGGLEREYQRALAEELKHMGLKKGSDFEEEYRTRNQKGSGKTDLVVWGCEPRLQIEVKADGDWRHVGEAVAGLFSGEPDFPKYQKVAAFGGRIGIPGGDRDSLRKMMDMLHITCIEAPAA